MILMVRGIETVAVPAAREIDLRADPVGAVHGREGAGFGHGGALVVEADVRDGLLGEGAAVVGAEGGVAGRHAEAGWEGDHFLAGVGGALSA